MLLGLNIDNCSFTFSARPIPRMEWERYWMNVTDELVIRELLYESELYEILGSGVLQRLMAVKGDVYYISVHFKQCFFYILMFPLGLYLKVY